MSPGQLITGMQELVTVTVAVQVAEFPHWSVTVKVTVVVPQEKTVWLNVNVRLPAGVQLSERVGVPVTAGNTPCAQSTVMLAGQLTVGTVVSIIVISWLQLARFPQPSIAVHVLRMLPVPLHTCCNTWSVKPVKTDPQRSVAVIVPVFAGNVEASHVIVTLFGQEIVGGVLSTIVMN
mgnify:CR=1 FL=1